MPRSARAVAALLAVGLVAAMAAVTAVVPAAGASTATAARVPGAAGPPAQKPIVWKRCPDMDRAYSCGNIRVPLDYSKPAGKKISVRVARFRSPNQKQRKGSILFNPGGPGASGFDRIAQSANFMVGDELADAYDVIGFDPRGVGRSTAVSCLDPEEMDAYLFDIPADPRGSQGWEDELRARNDDFVAACVDGSDGILPYITTDNKIDGASIVLVDIDAIRRQYSVNRP